MDTKYGLIFKDEEDDIWLGIYENGTVREFNPLSDFEGVYDDLADSKFAFVQVGDDENERIWINDVCRFEVGKEIEEDGNGYAIPVTQVLRELEFPSEDCDCMFGGFMSSAGKAN